MAAYTTLLTIGPAHTLTQNTVYALPARGVRIHSTAALEISPDNSAWDALTNVESVGADAASGFVRCTTASPVVTLKAY